MVQMICGLVVTETVNRVEDYNLCGKPGRSRGENLKTRGETPQQNEMTNLSIVNIWFHFIF